MRLITKINIALLGVVAISAALNFATLRLAVMPSFSALEEKSAERNQGRVLEAIQLQKEQVANSSGDYAIWDDTDDFMNGKAPEYQQKNVTADSLKTLGVNYFVAIDTEGKIVLDSGFDYNGSEQRPLKLFSVDHLPVSNPLVENPKQIQVQSALMRTDEGIVVIGYSPILRSDRSGERAGTLILGRLLDVKALKAVTKVDFDLSAGAIPANANGAAKSTTLDKVSELTGLNGEAIATLVSHTGKEITAVGERTILTTLLFLLGAAVLLLLALSYVLRKIAVSRIEKLRSHLIAVASTGNLGVMHEDGKGDELSETLESFNLMARQLADLRDKLRRQDYDHGAADQAAGLLHNVRNAISPVSALAWELSRADQPTWKQNLMKAVEQLKEPDLPADRTAKLNQFVALSAARLIEEDMKRQEDVTSLVSMLRHIDDILKEQDRSAQLERVVEMVDLPRCVDSALHLIERRKGITVDSQGAEGIVAQSHKVPLEQVLGNLIVNAAEAVEASGNRNGHIRISYRQTGDGFVKVSIADDGVGIDGTNLTRIFEKGYSTKLDGKRGLGLHWCANAINAMSGRLVAESDGIGKGATFKVTLPAALPMKEAA
jgi:two-component system NtrC family sensor kinase